MTGQPGSSSNIERTKGIRDSLKAGGEKYKIVADQTGNWMRSEGMRIVESVLPSLPKRPQVILSANDDMALGAIEALQGQGLKPGEVLVTGFDARAGSTGACARWLAGSDGGSASWLCGENGHEPVGE